MATPEEHMDLSLCAGTDLVNGQIVFSHDSKFFMCCAGWRVKVYSVASGQCAQLLEAHTDIVTGLTINPANKLQLFSCGLDGNINQWVYLEGVLLRTFLFYMPLHALISVDSNASSAIVIAQRPQANNCSVLRLALKRSRRSSTSTPEGSAEDKVKVKSDVLLSICLPQHTTVSHGCDGQYMAAVHGHEMFVYSFSKKAHRKLTTETANPFTCVACHPIEVCLATGHKNGNITFWWNMFSKDKMVVSSVHWHSLSVHCLAFSPEGSSLLSGGEECVLVRWQMNSEHKDFLPRLGSPLHSLTPSPDGNLVITAHSDNVLQLINSSFVVLNAVRGLARAHQGGWGRREGCVGEGVGVVGCGDGTRRRRGVGLVLDPRSGALVTNGRPGHLQFYSMTTDSQLFNLDIVGENYVCPDRTDGPHTVTEVEQAAFDPSGDWLATFQCWDDGVTSPELCLKFWRYSMKKQNYLLTTTVESPHYKAVQCLRFKPSTGQQPPRPAMVSTGHDGCFKMWTLTTTANNQRGGQWGCEAVGHYGGRGVGEARFSADGTTLAVVFDNVLTLWDPDTNSMMDRVVMDTPVRCIEFVGGKQGGQYLAASTCDHLTVLDLGSLSVHMQLSLPDALLAVDGDLICAVTSQQTLYMFRPTDTQPTYQKKNATQHPVIGLVFLPQSHTDGQTDKPTDRQTDKQTDGQTDKTTDKLTDRQTEAEALQSKRLYIMDSMYRLYTPSSPYKKPLPPSSQVELKRVLPQTPFQALLSAHQQQEMTRQDGEGTMPRQSLQPFKHLDMMNEGFSTEVPVSKRLHSLLDTLMLLNPRMARPMEVEECKGEEEEQEEEAVAMET